MSVSLTPELESLVQQRRSELEREVAFGLDDLKHGRIVLGAQVFAEQRQCSERG